MARVINYTVDELRVAGVGDHRPVPFLLSEEGQYLRNENRYLREKADGVWVSGKYIDPFADIKELGCSTMKAYAKDISDLYSYQECRKLYVYGTRPVQLVRDYREDARQELWTRTGGKTASSTLNRRSMLVGDFMQWAQTNGLVAPSEQLRDLAQELSGISPRAERDGRKRRNPYGGKRGGKASRKDPDDLEFPSKAATDAWLGRVRDHNEVGRAAACSMIIATGCRRQEAALLRASQLPKVAGRGDWGSIEVCYGTKGGRQVGDTEMLGKKRKVLVRRADLEDLIRYRDGPRKMAVRRFRELNPGVPPPPQLFLDERTGRPLSVDTIYRAWTGSLHPIAKGWSPHIGRHVYAIRLTLEHLRIEDEGQRLLQGRTNRRDAMQRAGFVLEIIVQPSLGHVDAKTTKMYLRCLGRIIGQGGYAAAYADHLAATCSA